MMGEIMKLQLLYDGVGSSYFCKLVLPQKISTFGHLGPLSDRLILATWTFFKQIILIAFSASVVALHRLVVDILVW